AVSRPSAHAGVPRAHVRHGPTGVGRRFRLGGVRRERCVCRSLRQEHERSLPPGKPGEACSQRGLLGWARVWGPEAEGGGVLLREQRRRGGTLRTHAVVRGARCRGRLWHSPRDRHRGHPLPHAGPGLPLRYRCCVRRRNRHYRGGGTRARPPPARHRRKQQQRAAAAAHPGGAGRQQWRRRGRRRCRGRTLRCARGLSAGPGNDLRQPGREEGGPVWAGGPGGRGFRVANARGGEDGRALVRRASGFRRGASLRRGAGGHERRP
ncbi:unnamed protein product, partial [Ectocarpus sp. 12 AP-2014]